MTRAQLKRLDSLCGKIEALQADLAQHKGRSDRERREYEAVSTAKSRLLDALRCAE